MKSGCIWNLVRVLEGTGEPRLSRFFVVFFSFHEVYGNNNFQPFIQINISPVYLWQAFCVQVRSIYTPNLFELFTLLANGTGKCSSQFLADNGHNTQRTSGDRHYFTNVLRKINELLRAPPQKEGREGKKSITQSRQR